MKQSRRFLTLVLIHLVMAHTPSEATIVVPVSAPNLTASSDAIVTGFVEDLRYAELDGGRIATLVSIAVDETWKGAPRTHLELVEAGGHIGGRSEIVYGTPEYRVGERVLVYARPSAMGWQTNHMMQGKLAISGATGTRSVGANVAILASANHPWRESVPLAELRALAATDAATSSALAVDPPPLRITSEVSARFTTQAGNPRFFAADLGEPLTFLIDDRGDDILGLEVSRRAIDDAFAAWNAVSGSSLELRDGGLTDDNSIGFVDGFHKVLFNDPGDEIADPVGCQGTLGVGGSQFTSSEEKTFDGRTFAGILTARITFADNWDGCDEWKECNFSEIAAHEGGHSFGLGHSSERQVEPNETLRDALMYAIAHFDERCADPREDDIAGIRAIYPEQIPVTITTANPLPEAAAGENYSVQLAAIGGSGAISWQQAPGPCDLSNFGVTLDGSGLISGTLANVQGEGCIEAVATDAAGSSQKKRFDIALVLTPSSPSPTPTTDTRPSDTPTPTHTPVDVATATPRPPTPTPGPCVGDCDGDGSVGIGELIRGVRIALGESDISECSGFDTNADGRVSIGELIAAVQSSLRGCVG